jgi:hypothetical protein
MYFRQLLLLLLLLPKTANHPDVLIYSICVASLL